MTLGVISLGAVSVGCFSIGALAVGQYAAIGDHAHAMIAIGKSLAEGSIYSHVGDLTTADLPTVIDRLDAIVPPPLAWAKELFKFFIR